MSMFFVFILVFLTVVEAAVLKAGVFRQDATLPAFTGPLAGYNYAPRSAESWPLPTFGRNGTSFMNPNQGAWEPLYATALVMNDGNGAKGSFCLITLDAIGADGTLMNLAYNMARAQGFSTCSPEQITLSASHSHSGPGGISSEFLWSIAPATDLVVPFLQRLMASHIATALVEAEKAMEPALIDIGVSQLPNVTHNRRSGISPYVEPWTVDTNLLVVRVDSAVTHKPVAVVWNFAIHGICYDSPNMKYSGDVMGAVNRWLYTHTGATPLFINGDAGDVNPIFKVCCRDAPNFSGGPVIGAAVKKTFASLRPAAAVTLTSNAQLVPFGLTSLNLTLQRIDNCTHGGPLDICRTCRILDCDANLHLDEAWVENTPRFSALRIDLPSKSVLMTSIPGEPLTELGDQVRADAKAAGFDTVLIAGYTNSHLSYFATANEYEVGGYEGLLTFWGIGTAAKVRQTCNEVFKPLSIKQ